MRERILSSFLAVAIFAMPALAAAADSGTTISGRILDVDGGLPIANASIELDSDGAKVASTKTDASGVFHFPGQQPDTYSILITANGYETTRIPDVNVTPGQPELRLQTAIRRTGTGLKTIGRVAVAARTSLQTSSTVNAFFDASQLEAQGFQRIGDALGTIPGVITSTSTSVGDDLTLSIRGYDPTETATLLDNHPIGPIGAQGGGFNYSISPFWGISGADVIFGSGATGLYGATTIAGAVNFISLAPTRDPHYSYTQGVGSNSKLLSGFTATGMDGKLGYALALGVQGTNGLFEPQYRVQQGLLTSSVANSGLNGGAPPPDLTPANVTNRANYYVQSGAYNQRNNLLRLDYNFSPRTSLELTGYDATAWQDKTGEGDNDYVPYQYQLWNGRNIIAGLPNNKDVSELPNGGTGTCTGSILVLVDTPSQYTCMNANQYAKAFTGAFGGGPDRWKGFLNQDYHGRFTQQLGAGTILLDGYQDNYAINEQKSPTGPQYSDDYHTGGFVASDEFALGKNDFSFGYEQLRQAHYSWTNSVSNGQFNLGTNSFFVKDGWTPSLKFSAFVNLWLQHSTATGVTKLNPRLALVFRPDSSDIIRLAGGSAFSEPDPFLITGPSSFGAPASLNPVCGPGELNVVGSTSNPTLVPETGTDLDLSYGHRFNAHTLIQADVYDANEAGALLSGNVVMTPAFAALAPPGYIAAYLNRIRSQCGGTPTLANLGVGTTYNAAAGRYQGINLSATVGVLRNVEFTAQYGITSAKYVGIPTDILQNNPTLLDGGQIYGIPFRQGTATLAYQSPAGFGATIDPNYVGSPNGFNRGPYWYVNATVSQQVGGNSSINLGVNNWFNSIGQNYGYVGLGSFQPQNQYGQSTNAFQQGSEMYGLPYRQYWLTVTTRI